MDLFEKDVRKLFSKNNWDSCSSNDNLLTVFSPAHFNLSENVTALLLYEKVTEVAKVYISGKNCDFQQFKSKLKSYDISVICGFVWIQDGYGYRCRTCCRHPDMVLCVPCFTNGNHEGHDFNKIVCVVGGVCDCGNPEVIKEIGNCSHHGVNKFGQQEEPPTSLTCRLNDLIPLYFKSFLFSAWNLLRSSGNVTNEAILTIMSFINDLLSCGSVTQKIIAGAMIDKKLFKDLINDLKERDRYQIYESELEPDQKFTFPVEKVGTQQLCHDNLLDFFFYMSGELEFNENLIYFINGLLTVESYKEAYIDTFLTHYSWIASILRNHLENRYNGATIVQGIANRLGNLSTQLLGSEVITLRMIKERNFHYLIVHTILNIFKNSLVKVGTYEHKTIDCSHPISTSFMWWSFVKDLDYITSHKLVIDYYISDIEFMKDWITILKWMQFMNSFGIQSVTYTNSSYRYSLTAEIQISVVPLANVYYLYSTRGDDNSVVKIIDVFTRNLADFLDSLVIFQTENKTRNILSFHLPLMRYCACFLSLALGHYNLSLSRLLENITMSQIVRWFKETSNVLMGCQEAILGYWSRMGPDVKLAALDYSYNIYNCGMIDMDILALQIIVAVIPSSTAISILADPTQLLKGIDFSLQSKLDKTYFDIEKQTLALERWLMILCWIVDLRKEINIDGEERLRKEVCRHLCLEPMTRSDLNMRLYKRTDLNVNPVYDIDSILEKVANFMAPSFDQYSGNLQNGLYALKPELWDTDYDPVFQCLRSMSKQDGDKALAKYYEYYRLKKKISQPNSIWPPYRKPPPHNSELRRSENILHCKDLAYIFICTLQMFLNNDAIVTEDSLALIVHLIHRSLLIDKPEQTLAEENQFQETRFPDNPYKIDDMWTNIRYDVDIVDEVKKPGESDNVAEDIKCTPTVVNSRESILSLLLKIHSKLHKKRLQTGSKPTVSRRSSKLWRFIHSAEKNTDIMSDAFFDGHPLVYCYSSDSLVKAEKTGVGISWGDGVDFIGHLLDFVVSRDDDNSHYLLKLIEDIKETKLATSHDGKDPSSEQHTNIGCLGRLSSVEERKQKALDRRKKVLSNMAKQQKTFAAALRLDSLDGSVKDDSVELLHCVICQRKSDPMKEIMVSLGILCTDGPLHYMQNWVVDDERYDWSTKYRKDCCYWFSLNWPILSYGLIIQTCGHVVHLQCFEEYKAHKAAALSPDAYISCPICRREVHHITPIQTLRPLISSLDSLSYILKQQLLVSLQEDPCDMKNQVVIKGVKTASLATQACSLLRSQLELELIVIMTYPDQYSTVIKRCQWPQFISYIGRLNGNVKTLIKQYETLIGTTFKIPLSLLDRYKYSLLDPILLEIPSDVLLNFIPHIWPYQDQFINLLNSCIVMAYIKGMVMISSGFNRGTYRLPFNLSADADDFEKQLNYILRRMHNFHPLPEYTTKPFETCNKVVSDIRKHYKSPFDLMLRIYDRLSSGKSTTTVRRESTANNDGVFDKISVDLVKFLIPLLRIAAVLRLRQISIDDIPENFPMGITYGSEETDFIDHFNRLCEFLNLPRSDNLADKCSKHLVKLFGTCIKSTMYPNFKAAVNAYVRADFVKAYEKEKKSMIYNQKYLDPLSIGTELYPPKFIEMKNNYEDLFNEYHTTQCSSFTQSCNPKPKENVLCLICGRLICMICQTVNKHSTDCCIGTGVIIEINTSIVFVIINNEVSQWGSIYLDYYGEEDLGLKRGRPLFLNSYRFKLLEQQWLTHSFKQVLKTWARVG